MVNSFCADFKMDHFVHTMSLICDKNNNQSFVAVVEADENAPQVPYYVVPVDESGQFFPKYQVKMIKTQNCKDDPNTFTVGGDFCFCELVKESPDRLIMRVGSQTIAFHTSTDIPRLPYTGGFSHPDFELPLCLIEADNEDLFDNSLLENGYIMIGCDSYSPFVV